jgi:hypothetical protein
MPFGGTNDRGRTEPSRCGRDSRERCSRRGCRGPPAACRDRGVSGAALATAARGVERRLENMSPFVLVVAISIGNGGALPPPRFIRAVVFY